MLKKPLFDFVISINHSVFFYKIFLKLADKVGMDKISDKF